MNERERIAQRQVRAGWAGLLIFLLLGLVLEMLHGFKVSWYLAADHETRRLLFVLAHAHGALLAVLNILLGLTLERFPPTVSEPVLRWISTGFLAALVLLPAGFFAGGLVIYQGDPGAGIALALVGAVILVISVIALVGGILRRPG